MYVDESTVRQGEKTYTRYLLRESHREGKKVRHRTIANLSECSPEEIAAIRLALRHKKDLAQLTAQASVFLTQGLSVGAVWLLYDVSRQLGIADALGATRQGRLALWQVIARVIDQGSRLSAVRLAGSHAACDVLGPGRFDEDDLYDNLDWLCENQSGIEDRLFRKREGSSGLYLYDVTSSYLEGIQNELSAFGYNRDGKKGKRQIVIGLLCDETGAPLSIEVFAGNTQDIRTFAVQVKKAAERFGGKEVTFVGDRGMIKSRQVEELRAHGFHYITAITKAQIGTLLKTGLIQMDLFDQELAEVADGGIRYVLRRNPLRAEEIRKSREDKIASLHKGIAGQNDYLKEHPLAKPETALKKLRSRCSRMKVSGWAALAAENREITLSIDQDALKEEAKLDGCYVLKSDLPPEAATKETVHKRYKDLSLVESAFRSSKTVHLELRPIHVRLAARTKGHVFVVMLAYRIIQELAERWRDLDVTVEEGINELSSLCAQRVSLNGTTHNQIPQPRGSVKKLIKAAHVRMPEALPGKGIIVATKKKLTSRRKTT
ncbi:MAG: IS1634 family transposase [Syntrophorhabdales bacterium]|jgi:transposase